MKAAFILDVGDGAELEKLKKALTLMGYPPQVVSSFGISLGNDEVTEEEVSLPPPPRRRGRTAELQEVEAYVRGMQTRFNNPVIDITLELQAPFEDQKILSLLQRAQMTGMIGLRNVER